MEKIDLNAPAFGEGAQKIVGSEEQPIKEEEQKEEEKPAEVPKEEPEKEQEEETKVPYSRFKKFHDEAKRFQQEAEEWKAKAHALENEPRDSGADIDPEDEAYKLWIENFGDSEASNKAWKNQLKITQRLQQQAIENAREEALEAVRNERSAEAERINENVDQIDSNFESLEDFVGRQLTDQEQSALLDIVDEYTPKNDEGNYSGDLLPFEKAWEIYELKTQSSRAVKTQARDNVAALSSNKTQGETSFNDQGEKDKNWNPFDWQAWRNRI